MAIWPFSTINALRNQQDDRVREIASLRAKAIDQAAVLRRSESRVADLEGSVRSQADMIARLDKAIIGYRQEIDELRGQLHSQSNQLVKANTLLEQARKNDTRGPKGRYVKSTAPAQVQTGPGPVAGVPSTQIPLLRKKSKSRKEA